MPCSRHTTFCRRASTDVSFVADRDCDRPCQNSLNKPRGRVPVSMIADLQNAYVNAVERVGVSTVNVSTAGAPYGPPFGRPWPRRGLRPGRLLDAQSHVLKTHHGIVGGGQRIIAIGGGRGLERFVAGGSE